MYGNARSPSLSSQNSCEGFHGQAREPREGRAGAVAQHSEQDADGGEVGVEGGGDHRGRRGPADVCLAADRQEEHGRPQHDSAEHHHHGVNGYPD
eukprot:scaffold114471_cov25-Prasinocladus_malaysianus.AAC.1